MAMPVYEKAEPLDLITTKAVFMSAVRLAMSASGSCPPFGDELKICAREQVEYMLAEDEGTLLVMAEDEVKSEIRMELLKNFKTFEIEFPSLILATEIISQEKILQMLLDLEWMSNVLTKMNLMKDFVLNWVEISSNVLRVVEDEKLDSNFWVLKAKLIEISSKVFEAVGYGSVVIVAPFRARLIKAWLPYIRKMKPAFESNMNKHEGFLTKEEEVWESMEGAMVSMVLALPSNEQAGILGEWMKGIDVQYPDLSEAFEIWCYRAKSAQRRLQTNLNRVSK